MLQIRVVNESSGKWDTSSRFAWFSYVNLVCDNDVWCSRVTEICRDCKRSETVERFYGVVVHLALNMIVAEIKRIVAARGKDEEKCAECCYNDTDGAKSRNQLGPLLDRSG